MIDKSLILSLVETKTKETGLFIVDVSVSSGNKINVIIDSLNGVKVSDCVEVNRYILANLDREKEDFALEVSSPGLDKPFMVLMQYFKALGKKVSITMKDGNTLKGKLYSANHTEVELIKADLRKKMKEDPEIIAIPYSQIIETKYIISFK